MDSETPSYYPFSSMIAHTLVITIDTHMMAMQLKSMFLVEISITIVEKPIAIKMPYTTFFTRLASEGMKTHV